MPTFAHIFSHLILVLSLVLYLLSTSHLQNHHEISSVTTTEAQKLIMAIEARHLNILQSQLLPNRDMINPIEDYNFNLYNTTQMKTGFQVPFSVTNNTMDNPFLPHLYYINNNNSFSRIMHPLKTAAVKSDNSGVTHDMNILTSRKRPRDEAHNNIMHCSSQAQQQQSHATNSLSFLGKDLSSFVQIQELEIERLISHHMEKVRYEVEKRNIQAKKIVEAIQIGVIKRLKAKDEEIQKIGKLKWALDERARTLCMETQIWRDLAQSNEATANALRTNLEHVIAQVRDDAESCCGSSGDEDANGDKRMLCKNCFEDVSCVLLLPCKHLCLCTTCGSSLHVCPVCKSVKNASVHINMC